jgi:hypothetical protein
MPVYDDEDQDQDQDKMTTPAPQLDAPAPPTSSVEPSEPGEPSEQSAASSPGASAISGPGILPPWHIPGTDWSGMPTFSPSTDDSHDTPQNEDRARRKAEDDPRGNGPAGPVEWWDPPKPDLTPPSNPFTPEAQEARRQKEAAEMQQRAEKAGQVEAERQKMIEQMKQMRGPDERGDYPMPPADRASG